mmetsp:Transcript_14497/g.31019  ORF Transcript_14497/g.31019 Transcript_14497/m.31019 type:complete len:151 (+) Transcript_14497:74-526(+)
MAEHRFWLIKHSLLFLLFLLTLPTQALKRKHRPEVPDVEIEVLETPESCTRRTQTGDSLSVHYVGYLRDGRQFDSSYDRNRPFDFVLGSDMVIKGWHKGLLDMCTGEKRKITIPPHMGYGDRGAGQIIPPKAILLFNVTLLKTNGKHDEL